MKRIYALVLAAALLLAFAACGKTQPVGAQETTGETEAIITTAVPEETTGEGESTTETIEVTSAPGESTSQATEEETTAKKLPQGKEEIVAYYNEAVNRVKVEKPGFTWTQQTSVSNIESSFSFIETAWSLARPFVPLDVVDMPPAAKGSADHDVEFNVRLQPWSSRLAPSMASSATSVDKGSTWELRIDLKPEKCSQLPKVISDHDHGKVFTVFTYSTIYDLLEPYSWLATMESFAPSYHDSWVKLTLDKETDRPVKAEYMLTYDVLAGAKFVIFPAFEATATISMHEIYLIG